MTQEIVKFIKRFNIVNRIRAKYLIVTPLFYSFGDACEQIYWALARANLLDKKLMIIPPFKFTQLLLYKISNNEVFRLEFNYYENNFEKLLKFFIAVYINLEFFIVRSYALVLKFWFNIRLDERFYFPQYGLKTIWPENTTLDQKDQILKFTKAPFFLPPKINLKKSIKAKIELEKYLGELNSKFVCLHVRDSGYFGDSSRRPYRNADIDNYIPAIKFLINNGFTVIRIGDKSMKPCKYKNTRFIESCFLEDKSEIFDLNIVEKCEFYIGMQSGPLDLAVLFNKPILLLNMYEWINGYPRKECDRGYLKKVILLGKRRISTFYERANLPFEYTDQTKEFKEEYIRFIENTPEDILRFTKEFLKDYKSGFKRKPNLRLSENSKYYRIRSDILLTKLYEEKPFRNWFELPRLILKNLSSSGYFY